MSGYAYPAWMRTIEAVRLANFRRLVKEIQGDRDKVTAVEIASATGISSVYAWQLLNGERDAINSVAARKIERKAGKDEGWMDTDFELWPFPDKNLLARVEKLKPEQLLEVQGAMRTALAELEGAGVTAPAGQEAPARDMLDDIPPNFSPRPEEKGKGVGKPRR